MTEKQTQALKLALEALKKCDSALAEELAAWDIDPPLHHVQEASNACGPAITAINEALADNALDKMADNARELGLDYEPIVERVENSVGMGHKAWDMVEPKELAKAFHEALAEQPAPPPECQTEAEKTAFAFGWWKALEMHRTPAQQQEPVITKNEKGLTLHVGWDDLPAGTKLYTSPQSKPWVGLTDDDIQEVRENCGVTHHSIKTIEAKLREKNA